MVIQAGGGRLAAGQGALRHAALEELLNRPDQQGQPGGELQTLPATSVPVGLLESAEFTVLEQRLAPGDKVVIYSDGVTEAQNGRSEFFEKGRLREIVAAHVANSCSAIHDAIQDAVAAFTEGAPQSDDITVLVLEFRGPAG